MPEHKPTVTALTDPQWDAMKRKFYFLLEERGVTPRLWLVQDLLVIVRDILADANLVTFETARSFYRMFPAALEPPAVPGLGSALVTGDRPPATHERG